MDKWINAEFEVPIVDNNVLVLCSGKHKNITFVNAYELASYDAKRNEWILEGYPIAKGITVTHWMPLPEVPEEVEG